MVKEKRVGIMVRLPPELHDRLKAVATVRETSLNTTVVEILNEGVSKHALMLKMALAASSVEDIQTAIKELGITVLVIDSAPQPSSDESSADIRARLAQKRERLKNSVASSLS